MNLKKDTLNLIKKGIVVITSSIVFTNASGYFEDKDDVKSDNNKYLSSFDTNDNNTIKNNLSISNKEIEFYSNIKNYEYKSSDEIAVMLSMNKDFSELNDVLFIAPLSKEDNDIRKYDSITIARYLCRDFLSKEFYDSIEKSISIADSIDWKNSNNSLRVLNISNQIYNSMKQYLKSYKEKNAGMTIQYGLIIKKCLLNYQPIDFYDDKIQPLVSENKNLIYIGNDNPQSNILLSDDSLIKQYYDLLKTDSEKIPTWSLNIPSLSFYIENYFNYLLEEYELQTNQEKLYAVLTNKKSKQKTLS